MQSRLNVKVLARESRVQGEDYGVAIRILIRCGFAEGVAQDRPIPDGGVVAGLDDFAGAAEVIGLDVVEYAAGEQADGEVVEPNVFLDRGAA